VSSKASAVKKRSRPAAHSEAAGQTPRWFQREAFILGALLALATIALYFPVSHHPFVNYDDLAYVVNNPHVASGLSWETVSWSMTSFEQFNWHPLTWISHATDVQLFELQPGGPHIVNMLFHVANVLLLFWMLLRATGYIGRSAMVAGLFALHPVNVESVAWIAERKNLLSTLFFLLAMGAYRWYASASAEAEAGHAKGSGGATRYCVVMLCFVLGLMSKPQVITLPFVLLLWDYWPLRRMTAGGPDTGAGTLTEPLLPARNLWWLVKEKLPLFALCVVSALLTMAAQSESSLKDYPFSVRFGDSVLSYVKYIGKAIWPVRLAPMYPHSWHAAPVWQIIGSLALIAAITALVLMARNRRYLVVGWFWFLGTLVPMIGLVHVGNQAMADRYAYQPFIGLFIMACWGIAELAEARRVPVMVLRAVGVVVLLSLAVVTHRQLEYWNDNMTLWNHTLEVTNDNYIAHDNLAMLLMEQSRTDEAMAHYRTALSIYASDPNSNFAIAAYSHQHQDYREALARYDQMISITPNGRGLSALYSAEGLVYLDMMNSPDALARFRKAIAIDPNNSRGWLGLGVVAERAGNLNEAIANYEKSINIKPMKVTFQLLAAALQKAGRPEEAKAVSERGRAVVGGETLADPLAGGTLPH
jgi:Tfp pilus assembly protein PilF